MQILVLGAGQLARMMSLAGAPLNLNVVAFDVNTATLIHPLTKQLISTKGLSDAIEKADVITAEFEHIPADILKLCQQSGKLKPNMDAILAGGDRRIEKQRLDAAQVANATYAIIENQSDFQLAIDKIKLPIVFKTALGGYDGKGQWRLKNIEDAQAIWSDIKKSLDDNPNQAVVAEEFVAFQREVSLIGVRHQSGEIITYQLTQNVHLDGVLRLSQTIQDPDLQAQAEAMFASIATELEYIGVLAIEFFDLNGKLLVNEIAPRVHNSGHWTQQGSDVCQFENHLRAVANLPLGHTESNPAAMINILGQDSLPESLFSESNCHIHWYGKEKRDGRKMGHINVIAKSEKALKQKLLQISQQLDKHAFPELEIMIKSMPIND